MSRATSKTRAHRAIRLDRFLPYLFSVLGHRLSLGNAELAAKGHRLTVQEWKVISIIADHGALTPSEIGRFGTQDKSTISWAIKRLKKRGLVATGPRPRDGRTFEASMTPRGWAFYETLAPKARRRATEGLAALSPEEVRVLTRLVTRLARR
jgi:DNA-binding MarR family transcriptional regulator